MKNREVVLINFGGVGEFMFHLDLSKRLEEAGIGTVIILTRKNYNLFSQFVQSSDLTATKVSNGQGKRFFLQIICILARCIYKDICIINAFDVKTYSRYTIFFYNAVVALGGHVIVYASDKRLKGEKVGFILRDLKEMIWKRNIRIVKMLQPSYNSLQFPVVHLKGESPLPQKGYIHIHVVASILAKSYPPQRTLELIKKLCVKNHVVVSMTPKEEQWYFSSAQMQEIRSLHNVTILSKQFTASEIIGLIYNSKLFCTVNTGLLWLSRLLNKKTLVLDSTTDFEWNPAPYHNVIRLCHDYDQEGVHLLSIKEAYPDGEFFKSMYLVNLEEALEGVAKSLRD